MSAKREQLVGCALDMFYQHGIHAVGINDLLKQAGGEKKTLYTHFVSKEALLIAALERRHERFMQWFYRLSAAKPQGLAAITAQFEGLDQWFNNQAEALGSFNGCFFINTAAEFSDMSSPVWQLCCDHKQAMRAAVAAALTAEQQQNSSLIDGISYLQEGAIVAAHVRAELTAAQRCLPLIRQLLGEA